MSNQAEPSFVLIRRLADGTVEWIPLEIAPQRVAVAPNAAYTVVDRADYEAPKTLVVQRLGEDLVVEVQGAEVLVLDGFFTTAGVAFFPTTNVAGGAGPFSGSPLTSDSPVLGGSPAGEQVVWSAGNGDHDDEETGAVGEQTGVGGGAVGGGSSPMLWVGLAAGGLGLALAAGGGGGAGGGDSAAPPVADTVPPQITSGANAQGIAENSGAGQVVYTATATDAGTITYSLKAGDDAAAFTINPSTGAVTLTGNPNFETKSSYNFTFVATDAAGNSAERAVSLAINNRDEVAPTITSGATATAINENSGSGQVVYTVSSTDTGDISTGTTTYSLKAGGDAAAFTINASTGAVTLTGSPDFETKSSYNFTVVATDAAGNSAERAVSLAINNLNDTPVTITSGATAAPIDENSGSQHLIYTVTATGSGALTYSLKAGGDAAAFRINANTGAVTLTGNPDFETKSSYNFAVVATDGASNSAEQAVSLAINNRDEVAPTITSGVTATAITENSGSGQVAYTVTSTDTGDISTGSTTYSLKAGGDAAAFSINASTGAVTLTGNPDYEAKPSYSFTVVATDAAGNSAERVVSLAINNLNDTGDLVTITSGATAAPVDENSGPAHVVYTVTATATGALTFSLKPGGDAAAFTINASTGAVTLTGNPDFETKPSYIFTVVATDPAGNHADQAVILAINNRDEVAPIITSGATAAPINENSGSGQVVYTVTSTDTGDISTGSTTYSLKAGADAAAFTINASTGAVTLTGNPDDETKGSYNFTVVATDAAGNSSERTVSLGINDLDEVAPIITSGATATPINENSGSGQVVYTVTSTDTGDISTGSTTYSLKAGGDAAAFTINTSTGAVTLTGNPDDETKGSYNFTVVATDAAGNSSERAVFLEINDLDEVAPIITSGATATPINENSGSGQVVYTVTSTDTGDISTGSTTYSLKAGGDAAAFTINASTGAVTLTGNPNFEMKPNYNFTVVATDAASNHAEQAVILAINNRDEVAPIITSGATATAINENSGSGQVVYTVTSTDTGDISTGVTAYSLKAGGDAAAFTINASTGAVTLTGNPDDETKGSYNFTVVATDAAGNSSERAVFLEINDLDEVAPIITSGATATAINENSGSGQVVYTVTSTDTGDISTGSTTYSLKAGGDAAAFTINASTGAVTLTGNPDFETKSSYNFTVVATDAASNSAERAVSLAINNRDEVAPIITSGATATPINENSGSGQVVYTVTSTDTGDISTGSTTYSLKAGGDAAAFTINASTGAVTLTGNPDFETKPSYNFTVVATDAASNSAERAVSLAINDVDEEAPIITSGSTATPINENSGAGQVVYTVTAIDTGPITYSLKAGADAAAFTINASTGAVTLTANPNDETKPNYNFTVVATDTAGNSSERAVFLEINDLDEVAPIITSGATATPINENSGSGQVVYTVTSTDTGDISTGVTTYSLKAGGDAAAFSINASAGAVTLTGNPDDETKGSYSFTVVATDAAGNSSERAVFLEINDLDEVAPTITSGATATPINENSGSGQVVYTVTSTDTGDISTGVTTYSLKAGGDAAAFTINASTGAVTLTGNPNFETKSSYNFTVVATDAASNSAERAVSLAINNRDEVAPIITSGATATAINENSGSGQVVYTVTSTDTGDISTGSTTYSLKAGGDAAAFTINASTGAVTLTGNPDFETKPSYNFTVVATDAASNSAERAVSLAINNRDEVAPIITSGATATPINENSGASQVVYTVTSTDTGDISTGSTTYSLKAVGDAAAFSINASTGAVTLSGNPDDETKGSYNFTVVATDAAGNSSERAVFLEINDLDEVAPIITSGATATAINENSGSGQVVYTVTSTDTGDISTGSTTYSLKAGGDAAAFTINASTGAVTLTGNPDFETKSSYNFTVVATDAASNSAERAVSLAINNRDEMAPIITSGATATPINENSGSGQVVYTVTSTDTGDISTGSTTYSLKAGGDAAAFTINASTGAVTLTGNPDFETKPSYNFTVVATDAASNGSEQAVSLAVNDIADETSPAVVDVALTSAIGAQNGILNAGDTVRVTVTMTENTQVDTSGGTPRIELSIGGDRVEADYVSGSGTTSLIFEYTIQPGEDDSNGISIRGDTLERNGGSIADAAGNAADLSHGPVGNDPSFVVDTTAPTLSSSTPDDDDVGVAAGQDIVLDFNEDMEAGSGNIVISSGFDTRTINVNDASQVSINGDKVTINPTLDLLPSTAYSVQIDGGALTDAAGNAYAGISDNTTLNFETEEFILSFGLAQGSSSDSSRTFQGSVSGEIDSRVAANEAALSAVSRGSFTWSGSANLGSDDRVMLVGNRADSRDPSAPANQTSNAEAAAAWQASAGSNAGLLQGSFLADSTLFDTSMPGAFGGGGQTNIISFANMPAGILTSQGLA